MSLVQARPDTLLHGQMLLEKTHAIITHSIGRSLDMWYRLAHQLDADIGIHYGGEMRWENDPQRATQLRERIQQIQAWGYPCRLITSDEMLALEPYPTPRYCVSCVPLRSRYPHRNRYIY